MTDPDRLLDQVHDELRALRKIRGGVNVESIAIAPTICQLLGSGDPYVAFSRLRHQILESDFGPSIMAAAASLGLTVERDNLLDRLQAFGNENYLEQRQVRRYSDKGLIELARMIVTNWPTETVPQLDVVILQSEDDFEVQLWTRHLVAVVMKDVSVTVLNGEQVSRPPLEWQELVDDAWTTAHLTGPVRVTTEVTPVSLSIVWRGELWPKFNTNLLGNHESVTVEVLGNKMMVRLVT